MLSVILLILKIIGIVIAAVLGLALFVILLVLFVPIRYKAKGQKGEEIQAEGKVSWLFGFVLFRIRYTERKLKYALRICGYKVFSDEPKKKRRNRKIKARKKVPKENEKKLPSSSFPPEDYKGETGKEVVQPKESKAKEQSEKKEDVPEASCKTIKSKKNLRKKEKSKVSFVEKIKGFFLKFKSIKQKIRDMLTKIKGILRKVQAVKKFLFDYRNRPGFRLILRELKVLWRHIKPRKFAAYIHFGMEDPSQTGKILGAVCAVYPQILAKVRLNPDFEQKVLEGDAEMRGRIRVFTLLVITLRVICNKEFKIVWNHAKELKEEL